MLFSTLFSGISFPNSNRPGPSANRVVQQPYVNQLHSSPVLLAAQNCTCSATGINLPSPKTSRTIQQDQCKAKESPAQSQKFSWSCEAVLKLLDLYQEGRFQRKFIDKVIMKKKAWDAMASKIQKSGYNVSEDQCDIKMRNLRRRFTEVEDNNNTTGAAPKTCELYEEFCNIFNDSPQIIFTVQQYAGKGQFSPMLLNWIM